MHFIDSCQKLYNKYCYPVLFNTNRPPIWPVIVTAIIIFIAIGEIGSQDCSRGKCNHYNNIYKVPKNAPTSKQIDSLISRIQLNHTTIGWRRALLLAMLLSLIIFAIFSPGLPDGFDFFLVSTILFLVIYFSTAWLQWHWHRCKDYEEEEYLLKLRHQIKDMELNNNHNKRKQKYYNSGQGYPSVMHHLESILSS